MNRAGPSGGPSGKAMSSGANSKILMSKTQLISDYRNRLKGALRSAAENIQGLAYTAKIAPDDISHKHNSQTSRTAHFNTVRNELITRATLIVKAAEELLTLNNDVKSFTILRDFKSVNEAINQSEGMFKQEVARGSRSYDTMRLMNSSMSSDLDKELQEQFQRNY